MTFPIRHFERLLLAPILLAALLSCTPHPFVDKPPAPLIPRDEPLRDLKTTATVQARDFGIRPDTGENIAPALTKLKTHLATLSEPTLVAFDKGTYRVAVTEGKDRAVFDLKNLQNLVIDGNGAEFIVNSLQTNFTNIAGCKNIIIRNFIVDGDPLPFTQGTVVAVDRQKGTFDIKIDPGYREVSNENLAHTSSLSRRWGMLKDPKIPGRLKYGAPNHFLVELTTEAVGEKTCRLSLAKKNLIRAFEVGDRYVQLIEGVATSNSIQDNSDITFQNITMHSAGAGYVGVRNKNINILACRTVLKDDRLVSSTADGILLQTGETGPWVEDVVFEGITDDAVNLYQKPIFVREVLGPDRLLLARDHTPFSPGDMLAFFDPAKGQVLARLRVSSVKEGREGIETVFDGVVPEVRTGGVQVLGGGATGANLAGAGREATHLYNENYLSGPAVIRNCVFKNSRNVAIKIQSHNVLVENVHIEGWDRYGIFIANLVNYPEGFLGNNFIVRNNLIKDCGFNQERVDGIFARFMALGQVPSASADVGNLRITENLIVNPGARAIDVASFSDAHVGENTIVFSDGSKRPGAILMQNTPDSSCTSNSIFVTGAPESTAGVVLGPDVREKKIDVITDRDAGSLQKLLSEWQERHPRH